MNWPLIVTWAFIAVAMAAAIYFSWKAIGALGG